MNKLSALFQFVLGFILGIVLLAGGTAALAYIVFSRMANPPEKPLFTEEKPKNEEVTQSATSAKTQAPAKSSPQPSAEAKEVVSEKPEPEPQETEKPQDDLPSGAYKATVTWSSGLSVRANPGLDAERVAGVDYNAELIILETSADGQWQKIRVPSNGQEGWVKAGNVEKTGE